MFLSLLTAHAAFHVKKTFVAKRELSAYIIMYVFFGRNFMTEKLIELLRRNGYDAVDENGVVMVLWPDVETEKKRCASPLPCLRGGN